MALPAEAQEKYIKIIDTILASSDLNTISEKRIRKGLQQAVGFDLTPQKDAIKPLIMSRFDKFIADNSAAPQVNGHGHNAKQESSASPEASRTHSSSGHEANNKRESVEEEEDISDVVDASPPKKKRKRSPLDDDAAFAAKLQAEENSRARPTRGGGPKKPALVKKKKTPRKKTSERVKAEDDSDLDLENGEKKVNRSGGFHKPLTLSAPLSALLDGELQARRLSRPQTVKRIWAYVHANDLQDPTDKRWIRCDDALRAVFKQEKVHMFTMNKLLAQNLYNADD